MFMKCFVARIYVCSIIRRHFVSSHNVKEKPTNNIPVEESDLKTAKSVFLSLRSSKLSKLQHCRTTAEARMAPPRTAAYEGRLVSEIFREPVQFKGAVEAGSFHSSAASRLRVLLHFCRSLTCLLVKAKPRSHLVSPVVLCVSKRPHSICFSCLFKDATGQR